MSTTATASGSKYVVAVIGATGNLGRPLTTVLARDYKSSLFSRVLGLVRNTASDAAQTLVGHGVELVAIDETKALESFTTALAGVDILIDISPATAPAAYKDAIADAALNRGIKLFFPCEWGFDTRTEYWGWGFPTVVQRVAFNARLTARAHATGLKLVFVHPGFFLDMVFSSPLVGFDHAQSVYTCYGSPAQRVSFTDEGDIARAVAELARLSLNPATAASVPEHVTLGGDTVTFEDAARIVERVRGDGRKIEIKSEDYDAAKSTTLEELSNPSSITPLTFLRILKLSTADGKADVSHGNDNQLVNPGQSLWKWKTVEEFVREKKL